MRCRITNRTADILAKMGGVKVFRWLNRTPRVLCYHGIDDIFDDTIQILQDTPEDFEKELIYLKKYFDVISVDEFYNRFISNTLKGKEVVITFDDGYKNNLTKAALILKRYELPFLVFVSCRNISDNEYFGTFWIRAICLFEQIGEIRIDCIDYHRILGNRTERINIAKEISSKYKYAHWELACEMIKELKNNLTDEQCVELKDRYYSEAPLSWDDVKVLNSKYGATIGSHCYDHFICHKHQSDDMVRFQLIESKKEIEYRLGTSCNYFAYPNGSDMDMSEFSKTVLEEAGYKLAFSTKVMRITSGLGKLIPRMGTTGNFSKFKIRLNIMPLLWKK